MEKEHIDLFILCHFRTKILNDEIRFLDIKKIAIKLAKEQNDTFENIYNFLTNPSNIEYK